jgi:methylated-DNA-protein-cysteine methyltransferase-like protein
MSADSYARIYAVVRCIPRGRVATYGQVAALAGLPHAPRVAGYALHALPEGSPLPWHRVVAAGGRLSLGRLSPHGAITQRLRLENEGVRFDGRGCADMERCRWGEGLDETPRRRSRPRAETPPTPPARAPERAGRPKPARPPR